MLLLATLGKVVIANEKYKAVVRPQAYDVLGILISLIGGLCSMTCSLLLPSLFFACLYWRDLGPVGRCGTVLLLVFGVSMLVLIVTINLFALLQQLQCRQASGIAC